jgi:hypothetical protein
VAQKELEVVRPDRFVDQARETGDEEYAEEKSPPPTPIGGNPRLRAATWRASHVASYPSCNFGVPSCVLGASALRKASGIQRVKGDPHVAE